MGRKVQISREYILETAFELLRKDGYTAINIKRLACELNCSTQPIAWQFGNMEGLRNELVKKVKDFTLSQIMNKMESIPDGTHPLSRFAQIGHCFLGMVYDEPKLSEFIRFSGSGFTIQNVLNDESHNAVRKALSERLGLPESDLMEMMQYMIIYTQGICSSVISGALNIDREEANRILDDCGIRIISSYGIPKEELEKMVLSFD